MLNQQSSLRQALISFICTAYFYVSKSRRRCSVSCTHGLHGLAFAAIWRTPQGPLVAGADGVHGIPELGGDARVRRVLDHPAQLALLDLPANFAAKLKVVALVVNGPRTVGLHEDAVIGAGN